MPVLGAVRGEEHEPHHRHVRLAVVGGDRAEHQPPPRQQAGPFSQPRRDQPRRAAGRPAPGEVPLGALDLGVVRGRVEAVVGWRLPFHVHTAPALPHHLGAVPADRHIQGAAAALAAVRLGELHLPRLRSGAQAGAVDQELGGVARAAAEQRGQQRESVDQEAGLDGGGVHVGLDGRHLQGRRPAGGRRDRRTGEGEAGVAPDPVLKQRRRTLRPAGHGPFQHVEEGLPAAGTPVEEGGGAAVQVKGGREQQRAVLRGRRQPVRLCECQGIHGYGRAVVEDLGPVVASVAHVPQQPECQGGQFRVFGVEPQQTVQVGGFGEPAGASRENGVGDREQRRPRGLAAAGGGRREQGPFRMGAEQAAELQQGGGLPVEGVEGRGRRGGQPPEHAEGLQVRYVLGLAEADQQGHADGHGRGRGAGVDQVPGGPPGRVLVREDEPHDVPAQGAAVGYRQCVHLQVDGLRRPYGVGVGQQGHECGGHLLVRLRPPRSVAEVLGRVAVGQGIAVERDPAVRLDAVPEEGVVVEGGPGGERRALVAGAHRAGWDSIP